MEPLQQFDRTWAVWRGRKLAYFAGCDYFRMASDPEVLAAAESAIREFGLNVAASRRTTGNHALYERLEEGLAGFFGSEAALLVSNGYLTNLAVLQGIKPSVKRIFIEERAHSSLWDAALASQIPLQVFKAGEGGGRIEGLNETALVMVDGVSSMDGTVAMKGSQWAGSGALVLVDDSHGAGVIGANGRGTPEHLDWPRERVIQTTTLSKAFGCFGGAILASKEICGRIETESGVVSGSTPFPLPHAAAALVATERLKDGRLREELRENVRRVASQIGREARPGPIIPVVPKSAGEREALTRSLLAHGIFPPDIRYQNGPPEGYFRFAISSEHTRAQLDALAAAVTGGG